MQICLKSTPRNRTALLVLFVALAGLDGCSSQSQQEPTRVAEERAARDTGVAQAPTSPGKIQPDQVMPTAGTPMAEAVERVSDEPEAGSQQSPERQQAATQQLLTKLTPVQGVMGKIVNYYRPGRILLSPEPQESLVAEPEYQAEKPLYGTIRVGDSDDNMITLVVDEIEGETPRIFIDRNNDEDLTNDGDGAWGRTSSSTLGLSGVMIDVAYSKESVPYTFEFYRFTTRLRDAVLYYRNSGREGEVISGDQGYKVIVLDENADGRFDDLKNGTLIIDLNQDGKLVGTPDSAEYHRLDAPFNIHGKVWEIASLSSDGTELRIRPSDASVEMRRYLDPGCPAPAFAATGLDEKPIDLAQKAEGSKYVLLDFWASWCGPCRGEYPYLRRVHARYKDHGLVILGINLDSDREKAVQAAEENLLSYPHVFDGKGWENEVASLYRVHGIPKTYLLNADLNIVAKDLRGARLESRLVEMLGPGDEEAVARLEEAVRQREPVSTLAERPGFPDHVSPRVVLSESQIQDALAQFESVEFPDVKKADFSTARINGSITENNQLLPGTVLAAKTNQGHYAKLMIKENGHTLVISWITYDENGQVQSQGNDLKIRGTFLCDLDSGREAAEGADFWWEQANVTERYMVPTNGAQLAVVRRPSTR